MYIPNPLIANIVEYVFLPYIIYQMQTDRHS